MDILTHTAQAGTLFGPWQIQQPLSVSPDGRSAVVRMVRNTGTTQQSCELMIHTLVVYGGQWNRLSPQQRQLHQQQADPILRQVIQRLQSAHQLPNGKSVPGYAEHTVIFWQEKDCFGWDLLVRAQSPAAAPAKKIGGAVVGIVLGCLGALVVGGALLAMLSGRLRVDTQPSETGLSIQIQTPQPMITQSPADRVLAEAAVFAEEKQYRRAIGTLLDSSTLLSPEALEDNTLRYMRLLATDGPIALGRTHTVFLKNNRRVQALGENDHGQIKVSGWSDIIAIDCGDHHTVGLRADGTVVATGKNLETQCEVGSWADVAYISAGQYTTVGITHSGALLSTGYNSHGQGDVDRLVRDDCQIATVACGYLHTVALYADGTVAAIGDNSYGQLDVGSWRNIVAIYAGTYHTLGLRSDGTVVAAGRNNYGQIAVSSWENMDTLAAGDYYSLGLRSDGTVAFCGNNEEGQGDVSSWDNVAYIFAGGRHSIGICKNGFMLATGLNSAGQLHVNELEP